MKICILGSGNVAHHLSKALFNAGHNIVQVYSRNHVMGKAVARRCKAEAISEINLIDQNADVYLIAVSDKAIEEVSNAIPFNLSSTQILAHTAGSVSIHTLSNSATHFGSFYPLQTFSKSRRLSFKKIPICIYGSDKYTATQLTQLAGSISSDVREINDDTRKEIHLSAVLACNFVTHLIAEAESILADVNVDKNIISPLLKETLAKTIAQGASEAQTGPARRGDEQVINGHLEMLSDKPATQKLYAQLSTAIKKKYS